MAIELALAEGRKGCRRLPERRQQSCTSVLSHGQKKRRKPRLQIWGLGSSGADSIHNPLQ